MWMLAFFSENTDIVAALHQVETFLVSNVLFIIRARHDTPQFDTDPILHE